MKTKAEGGMANEPGGSQSKAARRRARALAAAEPGAAETPPVEAARADPAPDAVPPDISKPGPGDPVEDGRPPNVEAEAAVAATLSDEPARPAEAAALADAPYPAPPPPDEAARPTVLAGEAPSDVALEPPPRPAAEIEPAPPPPGALGQPPILIPELPSAGAHEPSPRAAEPLPSPPERRASPVPAALLGGVVGAGLTAALALAAWQAGLLGPRRDAAAEIRAVAERVERAEAQLAGLGPVQEQIRQLAARPAPAGGAPAADVAAVREQLAALERRVGEVAPASAENRPDPERLSADLARLGEAVQALDSRVNQLDLGPIQQQLAAMRAQVEQLANARPSPFERNAALVIAANALEAAMRRGAPFETELAAIRQLGVPGVDFSALEQRAATGVPTAAALAERFRTLTPRIAEAARPAAQGPLDGVLRSVTGLVTVRPSGEPRGDSAAEIIARIEAKLTRGDLSGALTDFETLPQPARAAAGPFGTDLAARVTGERLLDVIKADILRGVARG
jgi:hypothetical protein